MNEPIEFKTQTPFITKRASHSDAVLPFGIITLLFGCFGL
jgi:hypothetical protein